MIQCFVLNNKTFIYWVFELVLKEKPKVMLSKISDDEENSEDNSLMDDELLVNDVMSSFNDNEEEDSRHSIDNIQLTQVCQHFFSSLAKILNMS